MLRITPKQQGAKLTLALEGKLAGVWVAELAKAWAEALATAPATAMTIDLRMVWYVDAPGQALLTRLHGQGCFLVGAGTFVGPIIQDILKGPQTGSAPLRWCWMAALGLAAAGVMAAAEVTDVAKAAPASPAGETGRKLSLTLTQALQTALAQNPEVHQAVLAIATSQEDRRIAAAAFLPAVEATAMGQRNRLNMDTLLGSPSHGGPLIVGPYNYGSAGLQASVPLFDLSLWNRWKAAQHGEQSAQAKARGTREAITALVVSQYFRAQRASEALKAAQSRVELAQTLEQLAQHQQKHGLGTRLDTLRAQVQVQNERQRLIQFQTQLQVAGYGLNKLLHLDPATHITLADTLAAPSLPTFTYQQAVTAGLQQRPELAALAARERAVERLQQAARSLRLPTVVATGSYGSTGLQGQTWINTYTVGVGIKVPLFTSGHISAENAKAKLELARLQDERKGLEAQVSMEVQVAQAELAAETSEVAVTTQAESLAQEVLVQARHRFEAGVSNNIEVSNAQDELARAADNRINALYRLNQSRADLARAMGQLEPLFAR